MTITQRPGTPGPTATDTRPDDPADLAALAAQVRGPVYAGDDPRVPQEVATFNLATTHHPAVVVGATCAQDVAAAVVWAVAHDLPVAVQATGHGAVTPADDALLVCTHRMDSVAVDAERRTALVGGGATWAAVLAAAAPHGLTAVSGSASGVGVVGFSLGGGIGPLSREYGFGADQVLALELVTADGRIRQVDAESEPELFWAVRGGKGSFGIVTSVQIRLVPVPAYFGGGVFFDGSAAREVLHSFRAWAPTLPERTGTSVALVQLPPAEVLPEVLRGRYVVHLRFSHHGSETEGRELLAPMLEAGDVLLAGVGMMPSTALDSIHQDPTDPMPVWEQGGLLRELTAETVEALLAAAGTEDGARPTLVELRLMGGALGRQPEVANAVAGREGAWSLLTLAVLLPGAEAAVAAAVGVHAALAPWATGTTLVNFLGHVTAPEQVARAWRPAAYARLQACKREVDPGNVFRLGHVVRA